MKLISIMLLTVYVSFFVAKDKLVGTTWTYEVSTGCVNTLKFNTGHNVKEYDCEMNYSFQSMYRVFKDTLTVLTKDNSHPEDHGKVAYYRSIYLIKNSKLYALSRGKFFKGKWKDSAISGIVYYKSASVPK